MQLARRRGLRPVLPRIVPWRDWSEWDQVRAGLLGAGATAAGRAIRRVRAWQSRCKVPHSVEATAALVEIKLASARVSAPRDAVRSDNELRLMYAMAIVRLVNGIVDAVQQKKFAAPVSDLADSIALPSVLVDIRHAASHNALPSLPALSQAADRALEWLRRHYWEPQAAVLTPPEQTLEPLLREYVRVRSRQLAASDAHSDASDPPATSAGGGSGSKGGKKKETKADKEAMLREAEATEHKARAREEKHAKRQATADDLLARLLAATPALDLVPALVEPMIAMTWQILKDSLSDFGLVQHREPAGEALPASSMSAGPTARDPDTSPLLLSDVEQELERCVTHVLRLWEEAIGSFDLVFAGQAGFRQALVGVLVQHLQGSSLFATHVAGAPRSERDAVSASTQGAAERGVGAAGTPGYLREVWLCFLSSWLRSLGAHRQLVKDATEDEDDHAEEGRRAMTQVQRAVARACLSAPSVWTRRLVLQMGSDVVAGLAGGVAAGGRGGKRKRVTEGQQGLRGGGLGALRKMLEVLELTVAKTWQNAAAAAAVACGSGDASARLGGNDVDAAGKTGGADQVLFDLIEKDLQGWATEREAGGDGSRAGNDGGRGRWRMVGSELCGTPIGVVVGQEPGRDTSSAFALDTQRSPPPQGADEVCGAAALAGAPIVVEPAAKGRGPAEMHHVSAEGEGQDGYLASFLPQQEGYGRDWGAGSTSGGDGEARWGARGEAEASQAAGVEECDEMLPALKQRRLLLSGDVHLIGKEAALIRLLD